MKRAATITTVCFVCAAACGGSVASSGSDGSQSDAGSTTDAGNPDAGGFCMGSAPRMMVNGSEITVASVTGKALALDCCDSAEVSIATSAYQALFYVLWRAPAGGNGTGTIDLANPPTGYTIELDLGCDPAMASCANGSAEERFADGFTGTIEVARGTSGDTVDYCVSVAESAGSPHSLIHSLKLYAPSVASNF